MHPDQIFARKEGASPHEKIRVRHTPALDGFRGIASIVVLVWHYGIMLLDKNSAVLAEIYSFGFVLRSGVDMFFVLSGFLIARLLIAERHSESYFSPFYIRRAFRILPVYLFLTGVLSVLLVVRPGAEIARGDVPIWSYWLMVQNYLMPFTMSYGAVLLAASWSVAVEEHYYLLLPLVIRYSRETWMPFLFIALALSAVILRWLVLLNGEVGAFCCYTWSICRFDSLMIGSLLAWVVTFRPDIAVLIERRVGKYWLLLLLFIPLSGPLLVRDIDGGMARWGYLTFSCIYAVLLLRTAQPGNLLNLVCSNRVLRYFGRISYGSYLYQGIVIFVLRDWLHGPSTIASPRDLWLPVLALVCTIALAHFSFYCFEEKLVRFGRRNDQFLVNFLKNVRVKLRSG